MGFQDRPAKNALDFMLKVAPMRECGRQHKAWGGEPRGSQQLRSQSPPSGRQPAVCRPFHGLVGILGTVSQGSAFGFTLGFMLPPAFAGWKKGF